MNWHILVCKIYTFWNRNRDNSKKFRRFRRVLRRKKNTNYFKYRDEEKENNKG